MIRNSASQKIGRTIIRITNMIMSRYPLMTAFTICLLVWLYIILFLTPAFETNDDSLMMLIVSGALTGCPSPDTVYISQLMAMAMGCFYHLFPNVNSYTLIFYLIHGISLMIIAFVFFSMKRGLLRLFYFCLLVFFFEVFFLIKLQFTSTAFVASFSGMLLILSCEGIYPEKKIPLSIIGIGMIAIGILLRLESFLAVLVISIPIFWIYAKLKHDYSGLAILGILLMIVVLAGKWIIMIDFSKHHENMQVLSNQKAISQLVDNPIAFDQQKLDEIGWSKNDLMLLKKWFWVDQEVYSRPKIINAASVLKTTNSIKQTIYIFYTRFLLPYKLYLAYLLLCLGLVGFTLSIRNQYIPCILLVFMFAIIAFFSYSMRINSRVVISVMFVLVGYLFYVGLELSNLRPGRSVFKLLIILSLLILVTKQISWIRSTRAIHLEYRREYWNTMQTFNRYPSFLFVVIGNSFSIEYMPLFVNPATYYKGNLLFTGWLISTPVYHQILINHRIQNLSQELLSRKDIYLVSGNQDFFSILKTFYSEHYGIEISFEELPGFGPNLFVKRIFESRQLENL